MQEQHVGITTSDNKNLQHTETKADQIHMEVKGNLLTYSKYTWFKAVEITCRNN